MLGKLLKNINPVEVIKVLKKSDGKYMTKGILEMGGSGALIPSGIYMIKDGVEGESWFEIAGGAIILAVGAVLAIVLSKQIQELKEDEKHTNNA